MKLPVLVIIFCLYIVGSAFGQGKYQPVELTGFNMDVVANGITDDPSSTVDTKPFNGPDNVGWVFISEDFSYRGYKPGCFLPNDGVVKSTIVNGLYYQLTGYDKKNALVLHNGQEGTLLFSTHVSADSFLYLLVTSGGGYSTLRITVQYDDDTYSDFAPMYVYDWCYTGFDIEVGGRFQLSTNTFSLKYTTPGLYTLIYPVENKKIRSVKASVSYDSGYCNILAVTVRK